MTLNTIFNKNISCSFRLRLISLKAYRQSKTNKSTISTSLSLLWKQSQMALVFNNFMSYKLSVGISKNTLQKLSDFQLYLSFLHLSKIPK